MAINKNDEEGEVQKSWTMACWWDLIQPGCKAGGFDKNDMSINYFLVCQSGNSHQDSHFSPDRKAQDYLTVKIKEVT